MFTIHYGSSKPKEERGGNTMRHNSFDTEYIKKIKKFQKSGVLQKLIRPRLDIALSFSIPEKFFFLFCLAVLLLAVFSIYVNHWK
jgi:hypothetical protein